MTTGRYQVEAVVLTVRNWGEADRLVRVFSKEHGLITAIAYGARRPRSQLAGGLQPFVQTQLALLAGKQVETVKGCEMIHSFQCLREDLNRMAYTGFLAELITELCPERQAEPQIYEWLLQVLRVMEERNPRLVTLAASWQLFALAGLEPACEVCQQCGKELVWPAVFDMAAGGVVCRQCQGGLSEDNLFSEGAAELLQRFLHLQWEQMEGYLVSREALLMLEALLLSYVEHHIERPLRSTAFIRQVAALGNS